MDPKSAKIVSFYSQRTVQAERIEWNRENPVAEWLGWIVMGTVNCMIPIL